MPNLHRLIFSGLIVASFASQANEFEARGNIEFQARVFTQDALFTGQPDTNLSAAAEPEFFWKWNDGKDSFEFVPFARVDENDEQRTHMDIRELSWVHVGDNWESRIGIRRVFWGVTEFQHLVDIINQSDAVEDIDNEDKLGQPMINLSFVTDYGIFDLFALPGFRERTFASAEGRPAIPLLNPDKTVYQHEDGDNHLDLALRWTHSIGDYDIGLSLFDGTSREPLFIPDPDIAVIQVVPQPPIPLVAFYQQITQLGLDIQATLDDTLWKLEAIRNENDLEDFTAIQAGFEHTLYGVMDSDADLGLLMEYGWDERGENATSAFQNDLFFGSRIAFNDIDSSEILMGLGYDMDFDSISFLLEGSKRIGDNIKVSIDVRLFSADDLRDRFYLIRNDDHLQLTLQYYY
jgi:hypothetical protein